MVTRHNLVYSIAAAQRILGIKTGLYQVQEWAHVVWVHGANFCRFVSKKLFKKHFADRRREEAKKINIFDGEGKGHYYAQGSKNDLYEIYVHKSGIACNCEDFRNQATFFKREGICKHGYAALNLLGFSSLSEYLERDREPIPVMLSNGSRSSSEPRNRGRSVD